MSFSKKIKLDFPCEERRNGGIGKDEKERRWSLKYLFEGPMERVCERERGGQFHHYFYKQLLPVYLRSSL